MGARVTLRRRLDWIDTDGAGMWHHSVLWRLVEAAEAQLHRELGIIEETFGWTPRRKLEAEFFSPVRFDDELDVTMEVVAVGRTSATYRTTVEVRGAVVATANMVAVLVDQSGRPRAWPTPIASALRDGAA